MNNYNSYVRGVQQYYANIMRMLRSVQIFFDNRVQVILYDTLASFWGTYFTLNVVLRNEMSLLANGFLVKQSLIFSLLSFGFFLIFKTYKGVWRYFSLRQGLVILSAVSLSCMFFAPLILKANVQTIELPTILIFINWIIVNTIMIGSRFGLRTLYEYWFWDKNTVSSSAVEKILLIGASHDTHQIINHMKEHNIEDHIYDIVGVIDNNSSLIGSKINGVPLIGEITNISSVIDDLAQEDIHIDSIVFTDKSMFGKKLQNFLESLCSVNVGFKYIDSEYNVKNIDIGDLFYNHDPILDMDNMQGMNVCVYGGTANILTQFTKMLIAIKCNAIYLWNKSSGDLVTTDISYDVDNVHVITAPTHDKANMQKCLGNKDIDLFINLSFFNAIAIEHISSEVCVDSALSENRLLMEIAHKSGIANYFFVVCDTPYDSVSNAIIPVINNLMSESDTTGFASSLIRLPYIVTNNDFYFQSLFMSKVQEIHVPKGKIRVSSEEYAVYILLRHIISIIAKQLWIIDEEQFIHELKYAELAKIYQLFYHNTATKNIVESCGSTSKKALDDNICKSIMSYVDDFQYKKALELLQ